MPPFIVYSILALIVITGIAVFFLALRRQRRKRFSQALDLKLLLVRLPQKFFKSDEKQIDFKDEINISSQLFSILTSLKAPFCLEAAVHNVGEEIHFYIGVPRNSLSAASRQIEGLFKDAQVEVVDDYNIFNPQGQSSGFYVKQKSSFALPLRTYTEANLDTFASILSGLSKIKETGEGIAIQVLVRPAPASNKKAIFKMIDSLRKGVKLEDALKGATMKSSDFTKPLTVSKEDKEKRPEEKIVDEEAVKNLEMKIAKSLLMVNYRVVASAESAEKAKLLLEGTSQGIYQFSAPRHQELEVVAPKDSQKLIAQFSFREIDFGQTMILNTEELASLFHLPGSTTEVPKIKWLKSKEAAPPNNLPTEGVLIGESVFRGENKPVYLTTDDRRRHVYILGQTGTGKTSIMTRMIVDDINNGRGASIIDPHGEFVEKILSNIPKERIDDVVVFDPADMEKPLGMNMLEYDFAKPEQKTFIINEMMNILDKLYDMKTVGGPMFEQYTRNAFQLLMEDMQYEPATLMEIPRIFNDDDFRKRKLSRSKNPTVIDFWEKEAAKATGEHSLANMTTWITSKFNIFLTNDYMRLIVGQSKSAFNFRQIMDEGKILLINLSKGKIGDINSGLLGMVILGKILIAALSRIDTPEEKNRRDFYLYIDEFQNFATDSIPTILSEARKYHLNLTMAHQFIAQLKEEIRDAVFGNVGSKIVFRVGVQDAEFLAKEFDPIFNQSDLISIDNLNAYVKILIKGEPAKPFRIRFDFAKAGNHELAASIKELSRLKYGQSRQVVEEEILRRWKS